MKYDELKVCTRCESDACYTQELTKDVSNHASIYVSIADAYGASGNLIKACEFYSKSADLGNLEVYDSKAFKNCK